MAPNLIKCLVRRSIINSKVACPSINWYIVVFVVSSLMMKGVINLEKWCLNNGHYSCPVVANFLYASNFEEELEEFLLCHFNEYWSHAYTTASIIFDVLVIIAALNRNYRQLMSLWLCIKGLTLIVKASYLVKNFLICNKEISALQLVVLANAIYSWYYVYTWSHTHIS
eukprot:XP_016659223.1 PREDICTED: uncharacterized protein LOC100575371 isoform X2 [Acyrthosiphon pisum]